MFCVKCQHDLSECKCPDLKERLKRIANIPNLAVRWCVKCDSHYSQCKCQEPDWKIKTNPTP